MHRPNAPNLIFIPNEAVTLEILELDRQAARSYSTKLAAFEARFRYPLGTDFFSIDHGEDYLAFFETLGEPRLFLACHDDAIVGVLVAVHRQLPQQAIYLGDLKVAPQYNGTFASLQLLEAFDRLSGDAPAYGISMDPAHGRNRLVDILTRSRRATLSLACRLVFFSMDIEAWSKSEALMRAAFGDLGWVDHRGRKDIMLESTGAPMPLLHLQHAPLGRMEADGPRAGHVHMFCLPETHPCVAKLRSDGHEVSGHASILQRGLDQVDWSIVLTSDI